MVGVCEGSRNAAWAIAVRAIVATGVAVFATGAAAGAAGAPAVTESRRPLPAVPAVRPETLAAFNQGSHALASGDWEEAERSLRPIVEDDPQLVEAWNNLGIALLRQGKIDGARAAFERAISLDPAYPAALQNAGLLALGEDGRPVEAAEFFHRAAAADPGAAAPRVNLAIALARAGRIAEARAVLLAARKRFPGDPDVLYHLGTVSERAGDRVRAAEAYVAFLAVAQGAPGERARAVQERLGAWEGPLTRGGRGPAPAGGKSRRSVDGS
jgi:Flp pilus assembly protein TadD